MKRTDENEEWMEEEEELGEEEEKGEKHQPISARVTKILVFYLVIGFLGWNFFNFIFSSNFCNVEEVIIKGNDCLGEDEIFFRLITKPLIPLSKINKFVPFPTTRKGKLNSLEIETTFFKSSTFPGLQKTSAGPPILNEV